MFFFFFGLAVVVPLKRFPFRSCCRNATTSDRKSLVMAVDIRTGVLIERATLSLRVQVSTVTLWVSHHYIR